MKKYTNKILITVIALFLVVTTILFCISAKNLKEEIKQYKTNKLIINH